MSDYKNTKIIQFSIIMPTFNRAFCIVNAINSALKQTYNEFELIIIDDASSDNTTEILYKKFSSELESRKIIYKKLEKNEGVCTARNTALKLAKNKWIAYLDSDNTIKKNHLENFKNAIEKNHKSFCFYSKVEHQKTGLIIGKKFDYNLLKISNFIDMGVFVHHQKIYEKFGGFDTNLKRLVDWDLILTYTKEFPPIFIDKILLNYNDDEKITRITNTVNLDNSIAAIYKKHGVNPDKILLIYAKKNSIKKMIIKIITAFIPFKKLRRKLRNV